MKFNISILIAVFIICHVSECLGDRQIFRMSVKGNVQKVDYKSHTCKPVENAKLFVFVDEGESYVSKNKDASIAYSSNNNGDFKTITFAKVCDNSSSSNNSLEQNKCTLTRIEIIAIYNESGNTRSKRLIYNTADLKMTQGEDGLKIFEIPVVDLTENILGIHCGD